MTRQAKRAGFTLIELLVVIAIVAIVAAMALPLILSWHKDALVRKGADQLMSQLQTARHRARYEREACGIRPIRMVRDGQTTNLAASYEFVHDPGFLSEGTVTGTRGQRFVTASTALQANSVLAGDHIQINNTGTLYRVTSVSNGNRQINITPALDFDVAAPSNGQSNYRIHRQFRQTPGTTVTKLPNDVIIDLELSVVISGGRHTRLTDLGANLDLTSILFGPRGEVVGQAAPYDTLVLWVRMDADGGMTVNDNTRVNTGGVTQAMNTRRTDGNDVLISVTTKTGMISSFLVHYGPVPNTNPQQWDPYFNVKKARGTAGQ
jgi:prepilin-type N-terminal cleavage/methylation domain-containing protein